MKIDRFSIFSIFLILGLTVPVRAGWLPKWLGGKDKKESPSPNEEEEGGEKPAGSGEGEGSPKPPWQAPGVLPGMGGAPPPEASEAAPLGAVPPSDSEPAPPRAPGVGGPPAGASPTGEGGMPSEVVIRAEDSASKLKVAKPPLQIEIDPYESIRPSLKPDESLLLAVSPLTVSWRRTHPETLRNDRAIQPWRVTFSPKPGIVFRPKDQLNEVLARKLEEKEANGFGWNLTIADEEGRVFHQWSGSDDPPSELVWSGQNDQGEWITAGRSYSAVYTFTDPGGSPRTSVGKPLLFRGIVHQEDSGLHVSLDSSVLFGTGKAGAELGAQNSKDLLRAAADLIKRKFPGIPINIRVFASTKELGEAQGNAVVAALLKELMVGPQNLSMSAAKASFSEQRVEIVLLNR